MDGFTVMKMSEAAKTGDFFVTVTGCCDVIGREAFLNMKEGAVCCNAGHFDVEVNMRVLEELATERFEARRNIDGYRLPNGRTIYVIARGRLVNLAAGDGHPAEIMDMSFAIQALSAAHIARNHDKINSTINYVPDEIDRKVAMLKLGFLGVECDTLTPEQEKYLNSWNV